MTDYSWKSYGRFYLNKNNLHRWWEFIFRNTCVISEDIIAGFNPLDWVGHILPGTLWQLLESIK